MGKFADGPNGPSFGPDNPPPGTRSRFVHDPSATQQLRDVLAGRGQNRGALSQGELGGVNETWRAAMQLGQDIKGFGPKVMGQDLGSGRARIIDPQDNVVDPSGLGGPTQIMGQTIGTEGPDPSTLRVERFEGFEPIPSEEQQEFLRERERRITRGRSGLRSTILAGGGDDGETRRQTLLGS